MIDTPGEYLERANMRGALMVTSVEADLILLVQDATEQGSMFPPAYTSMFAKPSIGIVTKSDLATSEQIVQAKKYLNMAGVKDIYVTSSVAGHGFADLLPVLGMEALPNPT